MRVSLRVTRGAVRSGVQVSERGVALASLLLRGLVPGRGDAGRDDAGRDAAASPPAPFASTAAESSSAEVPVAEAPAAPAPLHPPSEEPAPEHVMRAPAHVSEEPVLVESFAEPGAQDGAGAQITVAEPWPGYSKLKAADVIANLSGADSAKLAATQLYELTNRKRETVLRAVQRELKTKNGDRAAAAEQPRRNK